MSKISCKDLLAIYDIIGGKLICIPDFNNCTIFPHNIKGVCNGDSDKLLNEYVSNGTYDKYITLLPYQSYNNNNNNIPNYNYKNSAGFIIKCRIDQNGNKNPIDDE